MMTAVLLLLALSAPAPFLQAKPKPYDIRPGVYEATWMTDGGEVIDRNVVTLRPDGTATYDGSPDMSVFPGRWEYKGGYFAGHMSLNVKHSFTYSFSTQHVSGTWCGEARCTNASGVLARTPLMIKMRRRK